MNSKEINVLVLAYLGDTVYEFYIRSYLINKGIRNVKDLQNESLNYVSAKSQCRFVEKMLENNFFTSEEEAVFYRARNYKNNRHPKNCDVMTYKFATGLEAIIGYLKLESQEKRIEEIMNQITGGF